MVSGLYSQGVFLRYFYKGVGMPGSGSDAQYGIVVCDENVAREISNDVVPRILNGQRVWLVGSSVFEKTAEARVAELSGGGYENLVKSVRLDELSTPTGRQVPARV